MRMARAARRILPRMGWRQRARQRSSKSGRQSKDSHLREDPYGASGATRSRSFHLDSVPSQKSDDIPPPPWSLPGKPRVQHGEASVTMYFFIAHCHAMRNECSRACAARHACLPPDRRHGGPRRGGPAHGMTQPPDPDAAARGPAAARAAWRGSCSPNPSPPAPTHLRTSRSTAPGWRGHGRGDAAGWQERHSSRDEGALRGREEERADSTTMVQQTGLFPTGNIQSGALRPPRGKRACPPSPRSPPSVSRTRS